MVGIESGGGGVPSARGVGGLKACWHGGPGSCEVTGVAPSGSMGIPPLSFFQKPVSHGFPSGLGQSRGCWEARTPGFQEQSKEEIFSKCDFGAGEFRFTGLEVGEGEVIAEGDRQVLGALSHFSSVFPGLGKKSWGERERRKDPPKPSVRA